MGNFFLEHLHNHGGRREITARVFVSAFAGFIQLAVGFVFVPIAAHVRVWELHGQPGPDAVEHALDGLLVRRIGPPMFTVQKFDALPDKFRVPGAALELPAVPGNPMRARDGSHAVQNILGAITAARADDVIPGQNFVRPAIVKREPLEPAEQDAIAPRGFVCKLIALDRHTNANARCGIIAAEPISGRHRLALAGC